MQGCSRHIARESAAGAGRGRGERCAWVRLGEPIVTAALATIVAAPLAGPARAGEADAAVTAVSAASAVTATSAMVADLAALESAYRYARLTPLEAWTPAPMTPPPGDPRFDTLPRELAAVSERSPDGMPSRIDYSAPILMLEQPKIGPIVMEQPVRVYENDVTVKLRAPGRRRSIATFEVTF